jgi:hypothetical protein
MKVGIILFHKNIHDLYPKAWIDKCLSSISNQTFKDFQIYEINYGSDNVRLVEDSIFYSIEKVNYADAMNFIITEAFNDGCDYVFNTNLDDFYHPEKLEKQIRCLDQGCDVVSSDFCYVDENDNIKLYMNIVKYGSVFENLNRGHNVIAHPAVGMSRNFWMDNQNRYDINKTPEEDKDLWTRSINRGYKFYIIDEVLLYYRIHNNQVSNKNS